jgi:hypothetical protein
MTHHFIYRTQISRQENHILFVPCSAPHISYVFSVLQLFSLFIKIIKMHSEVLR